MNALDNSRIGIAAQALGIAQGSFEAALNYAHERVAFGKPIAHHQSVGNYLADMATRTEAARLMVYKASLSKLLTMRKVRRDTQWMPVWQNSSRATLRCGFPKEQCKYGGYGYTTDFPVRDSSGMPRLLKSTKAPKKYREL